MRQCFFCSGDADTLEDAWPRWITNQFKSAHSSEMQAERHGVRLRPWRTLQPGLTIRCVCRACNNGWMSQLETRSQHLLQPLLTGERCELGQADQAILARWALKTAMVLEALDGVPQRAYTGVQREQLRTDGAIPWRTTAWLAASADSSWFMSCKNRHLGAGTGKDIAGASITMAFAHLVLQVLTIRVPRQVGPATHVTTDVRRGPWDQATIRIWPSQTTEINWPPPLGLNGQTGFDALADRFNTSQLHGDAIETLEV
jgi:hypothetical protein